MKKIVLILAFLMTTISILPALGCGHMTPVIENWGSPLNASTSNQLLHDEGKNILFAPCGLHINTKNNSGYLTYWVTAYGSAALSKHLNFEETLPAIKEVVDGFNKAIYSKKAYNDGNKYFYQKEKDNYVEDERIYSIVRFYDYTKVFKEAAPNISGGGVKILTLEEAIEKIPKSNIEVEQFQYFNDFGGVRLDVFGSFTDKQKQTYKVLWLENFFSANYKMDEYTVTFGASVDHKPIAYWNGITKDALSGSFYTHLLETENNTVFFDESLRGMIIFNDQKAVLPAWLWWVGGSVIGLLALLLIYRFVIMKIIADRRNNKKKYQRKGTK